MDRLTIEVSGRSAAASPFSGSYEIKSNASGQSLGVQGDSGANSAPIVQNPDTGDSGASWTFVPESNGYYEIKNARTGQLLNVNNQSGAPGALIVQWPAGALVPGNDQWLPVQNSDGSWSFYNRDSALALDDTAGSTAAGTQYEQWSPNNGPNQKFTLVSRTNGAAPKVGSGAVASGIAGKCLDLNGGSTTDGTAVQLYDCNGTAAQDWTLNSNGTLQNSGKCLDATANGTGDGTLLDLWDCNGGANQAWQPYDGGLLRWWNPCCFPRCGAPDDYCRKPLPNVCWPPYPPYYTAGPQEIGCHPNNALRDHIKPH